MQRYLTSKFHLMQLKRLTKLDLNDIKQEVIQTKHSTQQILDVISINDPYMLQTRKVYFPRDSNKSTTDVPSRPLQV